MLYHRSCSSTKVDPEGPEAVQLPEKVTGRLRALSACSFLNYPPYKFVQVREQTENMPVSSGVVPEFQAEHNLRPRKKRRVSATKAEGYKVVIHLPKDSNKAFRVSNQAFQDALLKYYGHKGGKEGCNSQQI